MWLRFIFVAHEEQPFEGVKDKRIKVSAWKYCEVGVKQISNPHYFEIQKPKQSVVGQCWLRFNHLDSEEKREAMAGLT